MTANLRDLIDQVPPEKIPEMIALLSTRMAAEWAKRAAPPGTVSDGDQLLKVPEVARMLDVPKARVYELIRRGDLASVPLPGGENGVQRKRECIRVRLGTLRKWILDREKKALDRLVYDSYSPRVPEGLR